MSNIYVRGCETGIETHGAEGMVHDITIKNSNIFYTKGSQEYRCCLQNSVENVRFESFAKVNFLSTFKKST